MFDATEVPPDFSDDFPAISRYYLVPTEHGVMMYVPEDDTTIVHPAEALLLIYRLAPITKFRGAVEVDVEGV